MDVAVVRFPGSNCEQDVVALLEDGLGLRARYVWHKDSSLGRVDAVVLPGGFSYGDYLRCGAIARVAPILGAIREFAARGGRVVGICNGFQILCEAGLLPGALVRNRGLEYRCTTVDLAVEDAGPRFGKAAIGPFVRLPIGHGEGNFRADEETLARLEGEGQVLLRYASPSGNPNGSLADIAGIRDGAGHVFGLMPHPDRAFQPFHPSTDGLRVMRALLA